MGGRRTIMNNGSKTFLMVDSRPSIFIKFKQTPAIIPTVKVTKDDWTKVRDGYFFFRFSIFECRNLSKNRRIKVTIKAVCKFASFYSYFSDKFSYYSSKEYPEINKSIIYIITIDLNKY